MQPKFNPNSHGSTRVLWVPEVLPTTRDDESLYTTWTVKMGRVGRYASGSWLGDSKGRGPTVTGGRVMLYAFPVAVGG